MQNSLNKIFIDKNLKESTSQIYEVVKTALESFWEEDVSVLLQAVNDYREIRREKLILNIDFFSSQIKVENHKPIITRLSKDFVRNALDDSLDARLGTFKLSEITPLEVKILNSFCEFLYKKLKDVLIPVAEAKLSEKSEKYFNFLFVVSTKEKACSKIMISIPQDRVALKPLKKSQSFNDEDFLTSGATIKLKVGSSKLTLDELQNLVPDDIVVLENSELSKMTMISGEVKSKFNVKINPSLIINLENDEEEDENYIQTYEEVKMSKNLWDDIQIEINAEFEKVKMTIGELKQISQGQIVDLGSIFDNEISLFVEDRKVAKGELIIINDRYAVRLNEVLSSEAKVAPAVQAKAQQDASKPQGAPSTAIPRPQQAPNKKAQGPAIVSQKSQQAAAQRPQAPQAKPQVSEDEDFDYSDFEK